MLVRWAPPGAETREFQFIPGSITGPEAEAVEEIGGPVWVSFDGFAEAFNADKRRAYRAVLWLCLRRADGDRAPDFDDLEVGPFDLQIDLGDAEKDVLRAVLGSGLDLDPEQRAAFVRLLGEDPAAPLASAASDAATAG